MKASTPKIPKTPFIAAFSVGAVLFSAHAGGGFATGNQANTYYVGLGWTGVLSAIVAMLLLTLTMREAMIMYNSRGLKTYKQLFETPITPLTSLSGPLRYSSTLWSSWPWPPPSPAPPPP